MVLLTGPGGGALECLAALRTTTTDRVGRVGIGTVRVGNVLCVRTDKDNVAAMRIDSIGADQSVTISFNVWSVADL